MHISMFLCAALLASSVCGNLLATGVRIPAKLRDTAAGQRVVDIYKGLVGRNVRFFMEKFGNAYEFVYYKGTIEEVILTDIHDFITTDDPSAARLKLVMGSVQAEDPQATGKSLPKLVDASSIYPYSHHPDLDIDFAGLIEVEIGTLGEKIRWARSLAVHKDEDRTVEMLVEMESDGDVHTEIEPFITELPLSALPEASANLLPNLRLMMSYYRQTAPAPVGGDSLEGAYFSTHFLSK